MKIFWVCVDKDKKFWTGKGFSNELGEAALFYNRNAAGLVYAEEWKEHWTSPEQIRVQKVEVEIFDMTPIGNPVKSQW